MAPSGAVVRILCLNKLEEFAEEERPRTPVLGAVSQKLLCGGLSTKAPS